MRKTLSILLLIAVTTLISSCADMPDLLMWQEDDKPDYARTGAGSSSAPAHSRAPLDIPPSLRGEVEVPEANQIATGAGNISAADKKAVAGKSVSLDARMYEVDVAHVFSSVVDAMTALNFPVQSVDSPSGTVTTDWIREDSKSKSVDYSGLGAVFGGGDVILAVRYRFVVRVLRQQVDEGVRARLEIRTIGQAFMNKHWVDLTLMRKVSAELFSAVEERL